MTLSGFRPGSGINRNFGILYLVILSLILTALVMLSGCKTINKTSKDTPKLTYDPSYTLDPSYVLKAAGYDKQEYIKRMESELLGFPRTVTILGAADSYLVLARLDNNSDYYSRSCELYLNYKPKDDEESAIIYETLASLNCRNKKKDYLNKAAESWANLGILWRADILRAIASGKDPQLKFETSKISPVLNLSAFDAVLIGNTKIEVSQDSKVTTQVDRTYRDWLGVQLNQSPFKGVFLTTFSERLSYSKDELREDIGWHEGGRSKDIQKYIGTKPVPVTGTIVAEYKGRWYASDDSGIFRFEVPLDKISYPTTRFLAKNIAMIVDTHGVNMLVEQSIRKNADVVLSDCDHEDKVKAAAYLSSKGIKVICFPDRFVYRALGHNLDLVGSPVWRFDDQKKKMLYGGSNVTLVRGQKIVVTNADIGKTYAIWYYTTPWLYFSEINKTFYLDIIPAVIDGFNQTYIVYDTARYTNSSVIATRVFNSYDYAQARLWLSEDTNHKIILFHSTMYPYGIILMQEFPSQISFDDPNPKGLA